MKDHRPRFPRKTAEEINLIEDFYLALERLIEEDRRNYKPAQAASSQLMQELDDGSKKGSIYYESAGVEALEKWKAMTEDERKAAKAKGDDIDAIPTTDLEQYQDQGDEDPGFSEISLDFFEENDINLARAFLGYDGGYSIRRLKKFMKRDKELNANEDQDQKDEYAAKKAFREGKEAQAAAVPEGEGAEGEAAAAGDDIDSDESDIDGILEQIDDETFEKMVEEAEKLDFKTEEEAKAYFDGQLKEWSRTKLRKRKVQVD